MRMNIARRRLLHIAAGAVALQGLSRIAWAQTYPARPVRIVIGLPAGGSVDFVARLIGQWLSERLGQQFIIENRPGAAGSIATATVLRAAADGYTLLLNTVADAINGAVYEKLNFDFVRDIAPIASIARAPFVMVVNPSFPADTLPEFIAYAKSNPGKIIMASQGNGSPGHVFGELFKMMTGIDMVHVPYRGDPPALIDLIGGRVQVLFGSMIASLEQIRAAKLRPIGVTASTRLEALPDVPAIGETVPGFEASGILGMVAPKNTPTRLIEKLNREINAGLAEPKMRSRLVDQGYTVFTTSPDGYGQLIATEAEKWTKVIKFAGIKSD
jgi:tripartite-type tricarboxylate transporter receptor subunit TctC